MAAAGDPEVALRQLEASLQQFGGWADRRLPLQALVADESPAAAGEDRGPAGKARRYYWLLLAEGHLTRRLFGDMLRRIWALPVPAG